jgi:PST family polysaccharide transporter
MSSAAESLTSHLCERASGAWLVRWSAVSRLTIGVVLARLLTPADFGLMTLASVVLGLSQPLVELGIGGAVVQRDGLTERHVEAPSPFRVVGVMVMAFIARRCVRLAPS